MIRRGMGEREGLRLLDQAVVLCPQQTRIFVGPDWVGPQDFKTRLPNAVERAIGTSQDRAI
jgi:hypothetical protein